MPYHICVSDWTAKKAATCGLVFGGAAAVFLVAVITATQWQQDHSSNGKDWTIVFAVALGVPFVCCALAALFSFATSVSLLADKHFFRARKTAAPNLTGSSVPHQRKIRHPDLILFASLAALMISARVGGAAFLLVGIPAMILGSILSGHARPPTKIPLRDAILYVAISVALVTGAMLYVVYRH